MPTVPIRTQCFSFAANDHAQGSCPGSTRLGLGVHVASPEATCPRKGLACTGHVPTWESSRGMNQKRTACHVRQ